LELLEHQIRRNILLGLIAELYEQNNQAVYNRANAVGK